MSKKKYNPVREVVKMSAVTTGTVVGVGVPHMVMGKMPVGSIPAGVSKGVGVATNMMGVLPVVGVGNSLIGAVNNLGQPVRKRRR